MRSGVSRWKETRAPSKDPKGKSSASGPTASGTPDRLLSPVPLNERTGAIGAVRNREGHRASDQGFLPLSLGDYLQLLDWTARRLVKGKQGKTPEAIAPLFQRLGLHDDVWCQLVGEFGRLFYNVAGRPQTIDTTVSRLTGHRFHIRTRAREIFVKPPARGRA